MESLRGSVGFRCPIKSVIEDENGVQEVIQDGVNVTPSRESVIWDEETKDYIKKVINSAKDEAANIIAKSVKDMHNPFEWYELVSSAQSGTQGNSKLANLAGIVNLKELDLRFKGTKLTKNTISMLLNQMVKVQEITYASWTKKVSTGIVGTSRWFNSSFRYYRDSPYRSTAKDEYISEVSNYNPVLVAQFIGMEEFQKRIEAVYEKDLKDLGLLSKSVLTDLQEEAISILRALCVIHDIPLEKTSLAKQFKSAEALKKFLKESGLLEKYQETYNQLKEFMQIDKLDIKDYAELVIPKEKEEIIKQREEAEKEQEKRRQMSKQQIREENNEVVMHYPKVVNDSSTFFSNKIIFSARDTQIEKLDIINANIKVIYGFAEDREALAHYAEMFLTTHAHKLWGMYRCFSEIVHLNAVNTGSPECLVVMVSKKNGKLFTTLDNFIHVDDFELLEGHIDQEEVLTTSPELMTRFTKRYIYRELSKRNYPALMKVMQELNPEVNDLYKELVEYSKDAENYHSSNLVPTSFMEDLFNAMIEVQVKLHDNPELKVNELDLPNMKITDIGRPYALDPKMLAKIRIFTSIFEEDADTTHYLEVIGYYFLNNNQSIGTDSILLQKVREAFVNAGLDEFKIGEQLNNLEPVNLQIK